jgi:Flp pilus assembly secretin CpaC
MSKLGWALCAAIGAVVFAAPVLAQTAMTVKTDQAKMISVAGVAGTVVVGNPSIADVSVRGMQVFVHGKSQGATNIIVLDRQGVQIANLEVNVESVGGGAVAVFQSGRRYSLNCGPTCEPVLQVGDSFDDYFKPNSQATAVKSALASGAAQETTTESENK